jgi:hypothetical protein
MLNTEGRGMEHEGITTASERRLKPHTDLLKNGVLAALALMTPVFAVLYWLAIPAHVWPLVLAGHVVALVLCVAVALIYRRVSIVVGPDSIVETGPFGRPRRVDFERIRSALLVEVYRESTLETQANLFLRDADGRLVLRMRGQFWPRQAMEEVLAAVDIAPSASEHAVTLAELRRTSPELLYWFERNRLLAWI